MKTQIGLFASLAQLNLGIPDKLIKPCNPIFMPRYHTIESYRSQQRRAKLRRKQR